MTDTGARPIQVWNLSEMEHRRISEDTEFRYAFPIEGEVTPMFRVVSCLLDGGQLTWSEPLPTDEALFVVAGQIDIESGGESYHIVAGDLMFMPMGGEFEMRGSEDARLVLVTGPRKVEES